MTLIFAAHLELCWLYRCVRVNKHVKMMFSYFVHFAVTSIWCIMSKNLSSLLEWSLPDDGAFLTEIIMSF